MFNSLFRQFSRETNPQEHRKLDLPETQKDVHTEVAHSTDGGPVVTGPFAPKHLLSSRAYATIITTLFVLAGFAAIWFWRQSDDLENTRRAEQEAHAVVLDSLTKVKNSLERNLDSLDHAWQDLSFANDSLSQQLLAATDLVAEKEKTIESMRAQNAREEKSLRSQIQRLQGLRIRYETVIAVLTAENEYLRAENAELHGVNDSLVVQLGDANSRLAGQIRQTQLASFKATGFRVEPSRKNDRLTNRAKKTRSISIMFDLNDVPDNYRNIQKLYLSITDEKGAAVPSKTYEQATLHTQKGLVQITAQQTQTLMLRQNQRLSFEYELEARLKKGVYTAAVFTENGLLGAASFRLTR